MDVKRSREIVIFQVQVLENRLLVVVVGMPFHAMFALSTLVPGQKSEVVSISYAVAAILSDRKQSISLLSDR